MDMGRYFDLYFVTNFSIGLKFKLIIFDFDFLNNVFNLFISSIECSLLSSAILTFNLLNSRITFQ